MSPATATRTRQEIPREATWNLEDIFPSWEAWEKAFKELSGLVDGFSAWRGQMSGGAECLADILEADDALDRLAYKVWWYPSLMHDQDLRDNQVEARKQKISNLLAKAGTATSWLRPELIELGEEQICKWLESEPRLSSSRFFLLDLFRQQAHVLDEDREHLLSLSSRLGAAPGDAYSMLSNADIEWPMIELSGGRELRLSYAEYHRILNREPLQADRAIAFEALYHLYETRQNTYAALYAGVCNRGWFHARARGFSSTLEAKLHGNAIPAGVVHQLLDGTRESTEPLRRYYRLRKKALGIDSIHLYDGSCPLVDGAPEVPYGEATELVIESVAPLGADYQAQVRDAFDARWIDVYENEGKRSGAYSAPVHGVHPYMLLNYKDGLEDLFTLAHEMGHSMHTVLSHASQPFRTAHYTIFVAEVASTLNEALLLDHLLGQTEDPRRRALLLQRAIDAMAGTFYTQVLFADYETRAHGTLENDAPLTADVLGDIYDGLLHDYYGDTLDIDELYRVSWARIPHFFRSPFYVYQYATCFASAASLVGPILAGDTAARELYLDLLKAGGSDHPMELLKQAGVDLSRPEAVQAVGKRMDKLVAQLEEELSRL